MGARAFVLRLGALAAGASGLAACGGHGSDGDKVSIPLPPGVHLQLKIDAPKATHYEMLCQVRAYKAAPGRFANRYGVDNTGPWTDVIPSPNADCTAKIDAGPGPVRVTLTKPGVSKAMTIDAVGDAGKQTMHVW